MTCPNGHATWFGSAGVCTCLECGAQWVPGFLVLAVSIAPLAPVG